MNENRKNDPPCQKTDYANCVLAAGERIKELKAERKELTARLTRIKALICLENRKFDYYWDMMKEEVG